MSRVVIAIGIVAACGRSEGPLIETHYFADRIKLQRRIEEKCVLPGMIDRRYQWDLSLPNDYLEISQFRCSLQLPDGHITGMLPFTLQGSSARNAVRGACAIRIGPAPTSAPVPLDLVLDWFDDRAVANALRQATGLISYDDTYEIAFTTAGFHVRMQQFLSPVDGPHMELVIDGCGRLPDTSTVRRIGEPKVFVFAGP